MTEVHIGKIKIGDLPQDKKISYEEMRKVVGGIIINDLNLLWTRPALNIRPTINIKYENIGPISIESADPISIRGG